MIHLDHRTYSVPGILLSVSDKGNAIRHYTCGLANVAENAAMDYRYLLRCNLLTRSFMSAIVLRLADAQALDIDAPLATVSRQHQQDDGLLALLVSQYPFLKPVTVRNLINNTSGLPAFDKTIAYDNIFTKKPLKKWQIENYLDAITGSDVDYQRGYASGKRGQYSDSATNFVVAGLVVSAVSGASTSESMRDLFQWFGLRDTHYLSYGMVSPNLVKKMIHCYLPVSHPYATAFEKQESLYYNDNKELRVYDVTSAYAVNGMANAAALATTSDLINWWKALLVDEKVVSRYRERLQAVAPLNPQLAGKEYYGFGLHRSITRHYGEILWVAGNSFGSSVLIAYSVNKNTTFVLTVNTSRDHFSLNREGLIADILKQLF